MVACIDAVVGGREIYTRAEFERARDDVSATIMDSMFTTASLVSAIVLAGRTAEKAIKAASSVQLLSPLADMREQLGSLVYPGFVSTTGLVQLRRTPLYLAGIVHRIGKLGDNLGRDRVWMTEVQTATQRYESAGGTLPLTPGLAPNLVLARWMLEELRISLFAQHLGTVGPVSLQRIVKVLDS
jgi:ATP-dependent helicase HrpA